MDRDRHPLSHEAGQKRWQLDRGIPTCEATCRLGLSVQFTGELSTAGRIRKADTGRAGRQDVTTKEECSVRRAEIIGTIVAGLMSVSGLAFALDVADVTREWTPEGKKLAAERAKLPAHDEMVRVPAGPFIMGSDKTIDHNAYRPELPQRSVYLDAYEIDKFEVTTVQFLKFVLATNQAPLIDWQ